MNAKILKMLNNGRLIALMHVCICGGGKIMYKIITCSVGPKTIYHPQVSGPFAISIPALIPNNLAIRYRKPLRNCKLFRHLKTFIRSNASQPAKATALHQTKINALFCFDQGSRIP
jgi:hypothetical protein